MRLWRLFLSEMALRKAWGDPRVRGFHCGRTASRSGGTAPSFRLQRRVPGSGSAERERPFLVRSEGAAAGWKKKQKQKQKPTTFLVRFLWLKSRRCSEPGSVSAALAVASSVLAAFIFRPDKSAVFVSGRGAREERDRSSKQKPSVLGSAAGLYVLFLPEVNLRTSAHPLRNTPRGSATRERSGSGGSAAGTAAGTGLSAAGTGLRTAGTEQSAVGSAQSAFGAEQRCSTRPRASHRRLFVVCLPPRDK